LYTPVTAAFLLRRGYKIDRHLAVLSSTAIFFLPLSGFVVTTPQGLGDLFAMLTALLAVAWSYDHRPSLFYLAILAAAALVIHPITGIPALVILAFTVLHKTKPWRHSIAKTLKLGIWMIIFATAVVTIPGLFIFSVLHGNLKSIDFGALGQSLANSIAVLPQSIPWPETRYDSLYDFARLIERSRSLIILSLVAFGYWILLKTKHYQRSGHAVVGCVVGLIISSAILKSGIKFNNILTAYLSLPH
jgi:hypothetical protein